MERNSKKIAVRGLWVMLLLIFGLMITKVPTQAYYLISTAEIHAIEEEKTGWIKSGTDWYYYKRGVKHTGWLKSKGVWYYLNPSDGGKMAKDKLITLKGKSYYLLSSGAMVTGWAKVDGQWYYADKSGSLYSGWIKYNGKWYYMNKSTHLMEKNKIITVGNSDYYILSSGVMGVGWIHVGDTWYYAKSGGALAGGWLKLNGKWYYMDSASKIMRTGWVRLSKTWYYMSSSGVMKTGWILVGGKYYYLNTSGAMQTGWISYKSNSYYLASSGAMVTGWKTIDGDEYYFKTSGVMVTSTYVDGKYLGANGAYQENALPQTAVGSKTVKGLLANAVSPIGSTLYVYGGGHDDSDATRIGLNPTWKTWYNSQTASYDFSSYRYKYGYGLDCSGFVGWSIYNTIYTKSGVSYVTTTSTGAPAYYAAKGWGTCTSGTGKYQPGDIVSKTGHVWIVIGQCVDGSVVLAHATPPLLQISGTVSSTGSTNSEAIQLAKKYMSKYYSAAYTKFGSKLSAGNNAYLTGTSRFTWNNSMLTDPNGYKSKSASQVLADLFGE